MSLRNLAIITVAAEEAIVSLHHKALTNLAKSASHNVASTLVMTAEMTGTTVLISRSVTQDVVTNHSALTHHAAHR